MGDSDPALAMMRGLEKNHRVRDTLVFLVRGPFRTRDPQNPPRSLAYALEEKLSSSDNGDDKEFLAAIQEALDANLIQYDPNKRTFNLTHKAAMLINDLDIVICECGASIVRKRADGKRPSATFCHHCHRAV